MATLIGSVKKCKSKFKIHLRTSKLGMNRQPEWSISLTQQPGNWTIAIVSEHLRSSRGPQSGSNWVALIRWKMLATFRWTSQHTWRKGTKACLCWYPDTRPTNVRMSILQHSFPMSKKWTLLSGAWCSRVPHMLSVGQVLQRMIKSVLRCSTLSKILSSSGKDFAKRSNNQILATTSKKERSKSSSLRKANLAWSSSTGSKMRWRRALPRKRQSYCTLVSLILSPTSSWAIRYSKTSLKNKMRTRCLILMRIA